MMFSLKLKPDREKSVLLHHPWIFSGAVESVIGDPGPGETVQVVSAKGEVLGWAAYNSASQIRGRMWSWNPEEVIDQTFFEHTLRQAVNLRALLIDPELTNAVRLVNAESDGLPGLIVDRYADILVLQSLTAGIDQWKSIIAEILSKETGIEKIYEKSDAEIRRLEGLTAHSQWLRGQPQKEVQIYEAGNTYLVDIEGGQKTGFYLDQRNNRLKVGQLVQNRKVLNCFCYTGAFTVTAVKGGAAEVISVDSSADALDMARRNMAINHLELPEVNWIEGDVFHVLRSFRDRNLKFDAIILDPPKFAPTYAQVEKASRGYKDINLLAFKLLNPGGLLFTFSCSGGVSRDLFQKIVAGAAQDAHIDAQIIDYCSQAPDHVIGLNFPEAAYLKGLVCVVR
ncbi:MAG TPA: class I SAM-dependent rRNA methyltransferase [Anaerolineaceae bacterium]